MERLNVKALAVAVGASWGVCMLFLGLISVFGWGERFVDLMASVYVGYKPTLLGSIIGAAYGFVDGAIGGAIVALIYNVVAKKR